MKNNNQNMGLYIFECTMSVLYLAIAYAFLFTNLFIDAIAEKNTRIILGILLGVYGFFRVYRAVRKYMRNKKSEED